MNHFQSLDALVQKRLKTWPQEPPGLPARSRGRSVWLRGRPGDILTSSHPFLKHPGSNLLRTLPDGLWLNFGGQPPDLFVDIFAIEACASLANMLDKRARFAPSTHSLLAVCPGPWLLAPVVPGPGTTGASSHGTGQTAKSECVLGAKRARLSSMFARLAHASMAKISTKRSGGWPPKFSQRPSGNVRRRLLPGCFKNGCEDVKISPGRPRSQTLRPRERAGNPGGSCGQVFRRF